MISLYIYHLALETYLDGAQSLSILNISKCDFGGQQLVTQRDGVNTLKTLFQKSVNIKVRKKKKKEGEG
jgi:hypothetical protein